MTSYTDFGNDDPPMTPAAEAPAFWVAIQSSNACEADPSCDLAKYMTSAADDVVGSARGGRSGTYVSCTLRFDMGGKDNVSSKIGQSMNCGTVSVLMDSIQPNPKVAVAVIVLAISLILLATGADHGSGAPQKTPPLPQLAIPPKI